jgi:energy-coupling factor transporter ATP-binding protein EcfA2
MYIESARITNYRSILDSGSLTFSPGFNLVVGANNVGKSSLLHCLACKFTGDPHKSTHTATYRNQQLNPLSSVHFTFVAIGEELRRLVVDAGNGNRSFPWPADIQFSQDQAGVVLDRLLTTKLIRFTAVAQAAANQGIHWPMSDSLATECGNPVRHGSNYAMAQFEVNTAARTIRPSGLQQAAASNDFGYTVAQLIARNTYQFHAERLTLGASPYGGSPELAPDARNLPEVLNILQGNPERFRDYCSLVNDVFPTIQKVSLRPLPSNPSQAEIVIWQVDPTLERDDLAMPLAQCGTGVGQVLAILYVARVSESPRTIIIDEPGSFLHPGASRALIRILKRFGQHQYIIATHSPEIIAELSDAPVTIVRWDDSKTAVEQASSASGKATVAAALSEVGARLSDVYGFDEVLWVEGQSDALSLTFLRDARGSSRRRLAVLPVRDTGAFRRRTVSEVLDIYRTLSMGDALIPPALLFVFDRDGRTPTEIEDATRQGKGKVKFLSRRMFENFLLNPKAIAFLFNEAGKEHAIETTAEHVDQWIRDHGMEFCGAADGQQMSQQIWLKFVDAAALLVRLFADLSQERLAFRKTTHTPRLMALMYEIEPEGLRELIELFTEDGAAGAAPSR